MYQFVKTKKKKTDAIGVIIVCLFLFRGSENHLAELGKKRGYIIDELNKRLFETDIRLNEEILCESCKREKLIIL